MKWISLEEKKPKVAREILFTDGVDVFYGWLESYEFGEELMFYSSGSEGDSCSSWPEDITHWMEIPKPPKKTQHE